MTKSKVCLVCSQVEVSHVHLASHDSFHVLYLTLVMCMLYGVNNQVCGSDSMSEF